MHRKRSATIEGQWASTREMHLSPYRLAVCYQLQHLAIDFNPERLSNKCGSCQLLASRLEHRISSDTASSVAVTLREPLVFIEPGWTHQCRDSSNSCIQCKFSLGIVQSRKHLLSPISPVLFLVRSMLFSLDGSREIDFSFYWSYTATLGQQDLCPAYPWLHLGLFIPSKWMHSNAPAENCEKAFDDAHLRLELNWGDRP